MRKLIIAVALLAACKQQPVSTTSAPRSATGGNVSGAPNARAAVQSYMTAVANQDLQAMSTIWGSKDGSVLDTRSMPREEIEKRDQHPIGYWALIQLLSGVVSLGAEEGGGVAFWAHFGGLIAGVVLVKLFARRIYVEEHLAEQWSPRRLGWR